MGSGKNPGSSGGIMRKGAGFVPNKSGNGANPNGGASRTGNPERSNNSSRSAKSTSTEKKGRDSSSINPAIASTILGMFGSAVAGPLGGMAVDHFSNSSLRDGRLGDLFGTRRDEEARDALEDKGVSRKDTKLASKHGILGNSSLLSDDDDDDDDSDDGPSFGDRESSRGGMGGV